MKKENKQTYGVVLTVDLVVGEFESMEEFEKYWNSVSEDAKLAMIGDDNHLPKLIKERIWRG